MRVDAHRICVISNECIVHETKKLYVCPFYCSLELLVVCPSVLTFSLTGFLAEQMKPPALQAVYYKFTNIRTRQI